MPSVREALHSVMGGRARAPNERERPAITPGAPKTTAADETKVEAILADRGDGGGS